MSSRLQLDVCNLSLGMRHLVNAYEAEAGTVYFAGNTVIRTRAPWVWGTTIKVQYKSTSFTFTFTKHWDLFARPVQQTLSALTHLLPKISPT